MFIYLIEVISCKIFLAFFQWIGNWSSKPSMWVRFPHAGPNLTFNGLSAIIVA